MSTHGSPAPLHAASVEQIAEIAAHELREVLAADVTGLMLVSAAGDEVSYFGSSRAGEWSSRGAAHDDARSLPLVEVFQTGFPLWLLRGTEVSTATTATTATELHRVIGCAPLTQSGRRIGALGISYLTRPEDVGSEYGRFQRYAEQVALALGGAEACELARSERERANAERLGAAFANGVRGELFWTPGRELGNPLSAVLAAVDLLRLRAGQAFATELDFIELQVKRTADLVDVLTAPSAAAAPARELPAVSAATAEVAPRPRRVLLVDDNSDTLELVGEFLEGAGYVVRTSGDGPSALDIAATFRPELALLDLGLPGMSGHELARRLRVLQRDDLPKLVALTGYGSSFDRLRSAEAGFDKHLLKPTSLPRLLKLIRGMFADNAESEAAAPLASATT